MKFFVKILMFAAMVILLTACGSIDLPAIDLPAVQLPSIIIPKADRDARDFGSFSGVSITMDGNLSFDKVSATDPTGGGNIIPLFNIELLNDRLVFHLTDGRFVVGTEGVRSALTFRDLLFTVKFTGSSQAMSKQEKTLYVGPNLFDCVGVAPQQCMQVKENPEDTWKLFYDQIDGFEYEEGYLYELNVSENVITNAPADASSIQLELVDVVSKTPVETSLTVTTWLLESLNGSRPVADSEVTAIFGTDGILYGSAGCNSYNAQYQVGGKTITIQAPATTRMACPDQQVMDQEAEYLAALVAAKSFEIVGNRLSLLDESGEVTVTYQKRGQ